MLAPLIIFMCSQIDRYFALWQACNPNSWFEPPNNPKLKSEGEQPLLPFYKSRDGTGKGSFWTYNQARYTQSFGYTYDDFTGITDGDIAKLKKTFSDKHTWASRLPGDSTVRPPPDSMKVLPVRSTYFFSKTATVPVMHRAMAATAPAMAMAVPAVEAAKVNVQSVLGSGDAGAKPAEVTKPKIDPEFDREWYVDSVVQR